MTQTLKMGFVKWYNPADGFGIISPNDGGNDLYVNRSAIANSRNKTLTEGQRVEFSTYLSSRGLSAADVIAY
ncbi:cold-shock protein [Enterobacillus tribolii]|uniref:Putative cold-shock DNA-binding protein n=1 Tax=Enterobacillus tribolii TaxID=1487935 RepID=A0A370QMI2_9GAMM|nr:cold-shock protein [Enterobacillus tribolii]MBW7982400.1 cold-shock protein [Enterobacillus tribolii]RDK89566.1 putative cold-shock DNA-binding protein [Enterobacillus tribolii]